MSEPLYPCLIALGSNLGRRANNLDRAVRLLNETLGIRVAKVSRWIETTPTGGPSGQKAFLNGAASLETSLDPFELLDELHRIEHQLGRMRGEHWGPRTLDLDLLLYADQIVESSELVVPHPLMTTRRFVLEPAAEIASEMQHPILQQTIVQLFENITASERT